MIQFGEKLRTALRRGTQPWEFSVLLTIGIIALVVSIIVIVYRQIPNTPPPGQDSFTLSGGVPFHDRARVLAALCLGLIVGGLTVRKPLGVIASLSGSIILVYLYSWWYQQSLAQLKNLEVMNYRELELDISHAAGLWGATWWDIVVLAIALLLLLWTLTVVFRTAKAFRRQ